MSNELFEYMKKRPHIYGNEILDIEGANAKWSVKYFMDRLLDMFYPYDELKLDEERQIKVTWTGHGDVGKVEWRENYVVTIDQCMEIAKFIEFKTYADSLDKVRLSHFASLVVISHLRFGMPLDENRYKLIYQLPNGKWVQL